MKQYKHKKTGIIATQHFNVYQLIDKVEIPKEIVENTNDWQEITKPCKDCEELNWTCSKCGNKITKPEYTILSFINIKNSSKENKNTEYYPSEYVELKHFINNSNFKIYKVRRESDGCVFTVGDKVQCWDGIKTIERIFIYNSIIDKLGFWMVGQIGFDCSSYTLEHIQKVKQPLFTTEDGVDITDDSIELFDITTDLPKCNSWSYIGRTRVKYILNFSKEGLKNRKFFYTKEKAEEHILMNKPVLSLNDLNKNWVIDNKKVNGTQTFNKLKKLVEQKLKQ